jgi:hypothetical protein
MESIVFRHHIFHGPDRGGETDPHGGQVGVIRRTVISLIARGFSGPAIHQRGQLCAVSHVAGGGLDLHDKLRIRVFYLVGLIPIEPLFLALTAKPGIRVRGISIHIVVVIIAWGMLFLQTEEVNLGGNIGGINDVETIGNESLAPGLLHHVIEQLLKTLRPQAGCGSGTGSCDRAATPRCSDPGTTCRPG